MRLPRLKRLRPLVRPLLGFSVMSLVVLGIWPDLGVNLIADSLALWFGLFIIDAVVEQDRERAAAPARLAESREARRIHLSLNALIRCAVECTATRNDLGILEAAAASGGLTLLGGVVSRLDLDQSWPFQPQVEGRIAHFPPWRGKLPELIGNLRAKIGRFIPRYVAAADPDLIEVLQRLEDSVFFRLAEFMGRQNLRQIAPQNWQELLQAATDLAAILQRPPYGLEPRKVVTPDLIEQIREGVLPHPLRVRPVEL